MASHSNPLSSRPTDQQHPRNSDSNSAIRTSFSGYNTKPAVLTKPRRFDPVTPANSPSDFPRRRGVAKENTRSSLEDCKEKENEERDLNFSKLRSPLKGSKNFMSPTISAASKFTPSPRKKVLVERNDPVRTSISLCDGKAMFFSSVNVSQDLELKSEMGSDDNKTTETSFDLNLPVHEKKEVVEECRPVPKPPKKATFLEVPLDSQCASESLSESIAPLDADPSLPPYDPKTNYLSPRPQFLHYKQNPRIEILFNKEKGLDPVEFQPLDDSFLADIMPENFSESEETDESQTEDSQNEELEVMASADMVIGVEEIDLHVCEPSESLSASTTVTNAVLEENPAQKRVKRPWFFSKLTCFSMLLLLSIACASIFVTHSDTLDQLVIKDMSFSDLRNSLRTSSIAANVKVSFHRLARHVNEFSVNSMSFISELTNKYGEGETLGPRQFMNLTDLQKSIWDEGQFLNNNHVSKELIESIEEDEELEEDVDAETEASEEETRAETDSDESFDDEYNTRYDVLETEPVSPDYPVILAESESEISEIAKDGTEVSDVDTKNWNDERVEDQLNTVSHEPDVKFEAEEVEVASDRLEAEKIDSEEFVSSSASGDFTALNQESPLEDVHSLAENPQSLPMLESAREEMENKFLAHHVVGISALFVALCAVAAAFLYKQKKNSSLANAVAKVDPLLTKPIYQEKQFSQNHHTEVDDVMGESCPSEMSSFQKSTSYFTKEQKGESEAQSFERRPRKFSKRESLASSSGFSSDSPSYGSFTTFERIPMKHVNGEDEIVTPVRRSSRIRKQFPSP